jgi:PAS domain S-box-containing protein
MEQETGGQGGSLSERVLCTLRDLVYILDLADRRVVYRNRAFDELVGDNPPDPLGTPELFTTIHPDDTSRLEEHYARAATVEDGESLAVEYRVRDRGGEWRWLLDRGVVFERTPEGKPRLLLGSAHDITARKQMDEALLKRQNVLQAFLDYTPAMMIAVDLEGRILLVNPQIEMYLRAKNTDLLGKTVHDVLPPPAAASVREANEEVVATGQPSVTEQELPGRGGTRMVLSTRFPIHGVGGVIQAIGTVGIDITRAKRAEIDRAAMQAKLIEAQQATIQELATPLLPLARGVVAMPIVGTVDSTRARQIIETLLGGIASCRANLAILDITGVKVVDTQVAQAIVQAAQAARLLGAEVVLTGIKPQIAQTLVIMGADLTGVVTESTLEAGIAYALAKRQKR